MCGCITNIPLTSRLILYRPGQTTTPPDWRTPIVSLNPNSRVYHDDCDPSDLAVRPISRIEKVLDVLSVDARAQTLCLPDNCIIRIKWATGTWWHLPQAHSITPFHLQAHPVFCVVGETTRRCFQNDGNCFKGYVPPNRQMDQRWQSTLVEVAMIQREGWFYNITDGPDRLHMGFVREMNVYPITTWLIDQQLAQCPHPGWAGCEIRDGPDMGDGTRWHRVRTRWNKRALVSCYRSPLSSPSSSS